MSTGFWGADETSEQKPMWPQVLRPARTEYPDANQSANTFATDGGWVKQWPWGDEVLVAITALATKLGVSNLATLVFSSIAGTAADGSGKLVNAASQVLAVSVGFNELVEVTGTPTIELISANFANVALSYNAALSTANTTGLLVFRTSLNLAAYGPDTLTINSSSVVAGFDGIVDLTANVVANGVPASVSVSVPVYQEKPVQSVTIPVGTATNTVGQFIKFGIKFNEPVTLTSVPFLTAIADANAQAVGNLTLTYTATGSDLAQGNLVFTSATTNFSALVNASVYTVNASSNVQGWTGIKNVVGGTPTAALAVANTFTVTVV